MAKSANEVIAVRPTNMIATGKSTSGSIMFDTVPATIKLPRQMTLVINAYFDIVEERGGKHQPVKLEDINNHADFKQYRQDASDILKHYKLKIEGAKPWKYDQGLIQLGQFS